MKQQIIISGRGGQGVLTVTRILAQAGADQGLAVISSETHGMAQRGGAVISMVKVGPFHGPLIATGQADIGLFLQAGNLAVHGFLLAPTAAVFVNTSEPGKYFAIDAFTLAATLDLPPVNVNLILLGFAAASSKLFCPTGILEDVIARTTTSSFREASLRAFQAGLQAANP